MKNLVIIVAALLFSASVRSNGLYGGAEVGRATVQANLDSGYSIDQDGYAYAAFLGHRFHPNFAVELSAVNFGKHSARDGYGHDQIKLHAIQAKVIGSLALRDNVSLFAYTGVARITSESEGGYRYYSYSTSETKSKALLGLGAQVAIAKNLAIRGQYTKYDNFGGVRLSGWAAGIQYSF